MTDHTQFLSYVSNYVRQNPEIAAKVTDFVQHGLNQALNETRERAIDMEVALVAVTAKRFKGADGLLLSKLKKWEGRTSVNWESLIAELETK